MVKERIKSIIFITIIFLLLLFMMGCLSNIHFYNDEHIKNINYNFSFDTHLLIDERFDLHFEDKIFNEALALSTYKELQNDYDALNNVFNLDTNLYIYVVEDTKKEQAFYAKNSLYCTIDDIKSLAYQSVLTKAYLNKYELWKQHGAYHYIFGESKDNNDILTTYYNEESNLLTLSLFSAFFNDAFADASTIETAYLTAESYTKYLIDTHGGDSFLSCGLSGGNRQDWLNNIGVSLIYDMPYNISWLNNATYSHSDAAYPLIITTANRVYNISPIPKTFGSSDYVLKNAFDTPLLILEQLSECNAAMEDILSHIKINAPLSYPKILARYNSKITIFINDRISYSHANAKDSQIHLNDLDDFEHEIIHILTYADYSHKHIWQAEGIAEYLSKEIPNRYTAFGGRLFKALNMNFESEDYDTKTFAELWKAYYQDKKPLSSTLEEFDFALAYEGIAAVTLTNENLNLNSVMPIAAQSVAERHPQSLPFLRFEGNDLSYPEAYLLIKYLVDNYGLDTVLEFCFDTGYNFPQHFGKSYGQIFNEFITKYQQS
ncbi:MAG: hypothetical protein WC292_04425 [Clostridia bacterium]